ncbi:integrin beta-7 [Paramormyrops kingsleyae]|nr:integrin beta-7 isoform X1 [Paramormyrops kingsleyae]XP_023696609.1 integrin beta-7 isoform X1 [Paramormyrops kingsleyae]XP_023696610.1 integrin beta-7 isoform X1 [Paramormyrops kingsleyae]XP_023696611.1 integrin beta-7 isoform X1 [Paramormyrops kingsleyae]
MKMAWLLVALLHFVRLLQTLETPMECRPQPTCQECLKSPYCAWCKEKDFLKFGESNERRCDNEKALRKRNCSDVFNRDSVKDTRRDDDLSSDPDNIVQLRPQNLYLKLRVGEPMTFNVEFKRAEGYPIDLYYLMDLSYSMKDDLGNIKNLGQKILDNLLRVTRKVRIGFGSFVDKVSMPYVSTVNAKLINPCPSRLDTCQPAFSFKNVLGLTEDGNEFKRKVSEQKISGNLDSPEGGLDAMIQAAVCQDQIGWGNVTRILVYTSDDTYHMAGDGRLAGIYHPNDGRCHLNAEGVYDKATIYDYPSVGQLSRVLSANNIQLIFAVTEHSIPTYKALSHLIPQSVVGVLEKDSSNVVQLISDAYGNLSSTILLEYQQAPLGLNISFRSQCSKGEYSEWDRTGRCNNVKIGQQVNFAVRLSASTCLSKAETFLIKVQGLREELKVTVETLCDCDCDDREHSATHCNGDGTLHCGMCSCYGNHLGQRCECQRQRDTDTVHEIEAQCRQSNSSQPCSGQGSCECGKCQCRSPYWGEFCQCDDTSCERFDGKMCGDQGACKCGNCQCKAGFSGSACECDTRTDKCNKGSLMCNNHGNCICNRCKCEPGFFRDQCTELSSPCQTYKNCVKCTVLKEGKEGLEANCSEVCGSVRPSRIPDAQQFDCQIEEITFEVEMDKENGAIKIAYADTPGTIDKTRVAVGTAVSAVILIGILIIIVYRVLLEVYDRREYRKFELEQKKVEWKSSQNPLFQGATTITMNPMHVED